MAEDPTSLDNFYDHLADFLETENVLTTDLTLDLDQKGINDRDAFSIADRISLFSNAFAFNIILTSNTISDRGVQALSKSLRNIANIKKLHLKLSNNKISYDSACNLALILSEVNTITDLCVNLDSEIYAGVTDLYNQLYNFLKKQDTSLFLNLKSKSIGNLGLRDISKNISILNSVVDLSIDFRRNKIGDVGGRFLSKAISSLDNLKTLKFNLGNNFISFASATFIGHYLGQMKSLKDLVLDLDSEEMPYGGITSLGKNVYTHVKSNSREISLNYAQMNLGDRGLKEMGEGLEGLCFFSVIKIELGRNNIKDKAINIFSNGLSSLPDSVFSLSLNCFRNCITDEGATTLADILSRKKNLIHLKVDLRNNLKISNTGAKKIRDIIYKFQNITDIQFELPGNKNEELERSLELVQRRRYHMIKAKALKMNSILKREDVLQFL